MKGNVALTAAGEVLLPWARRVLADVDGASLEVRELADLRRGRLAVGATPSLTTTVLPPALTRFHQSFPAIDLVLHEAGSRDLVQELEQGVLDIALVILPLRHEVLETTPLLREELVVAVPHTHPFAARKTVSIGDLKGAPLVMFRDGYDLRAATLAACRRAGFEPSFALEGAEMDGVLRLAAAGLGVAVVPSLVIDPGGALRASPSRSRGRSGSRTAAIDGSRAPAASSWTPCGRSCADASGCAAGRPASRSSTRRSANEALLARRGR